MARALIKERPDAKEDAFAAEFEAPEFLTLGILYDQGKTFSGGAYRPFLRRVDRFRNEKLAASLQKREGQASRLLEIDARVGEIMDELQKRGMRSSYLRTYIVARINPLRSDRTRRKGGPPPMEMNAALIRMMNAAKKFDPSTVRFGDIALVAAVMGGQE